MLLCLRTSFVVYFSTFSRILFLLTTVFLVARNMLETHQKRVLQSPTEKLPQRKKASHQRAPKLPQRPISCSPCWLAQSTWLLKIMDETLVCTKTRLTCPLQKSQSKKQPLGGHDPFKLVQGHRTTQQKGRFLFQTLQSIGSVDLGAKGTWKWNYWCCCSAIAQFLLYFSCPVPSLRNVLVRRFRNFD